MSSWTHVLGSIKIDGITVDACKKMFGIKKKKDIPAYFEDLNNFKVIRNTKRIKTDLIRDLTKPIKKLISTIPVPSGSEGDMELEYNLHTKRIKIWGNSASTASSALYNKKLNTINEDYYTEENAKDWENVWVEDRGECFVLNLFGDLRHSDETLFKKEFEIFLKTLKKYFYVESVFVKCTCWDKQLIWETKGWDNSDIHFREELFEI